MMNTFIDIISAMSLLLGCVFFATGIAGLFRLPDLYCRLHALTKADNAGLGLIVFAVVLQVDDGLLQLKMLFVWGLVLIASACMGTLIANAAHQRGIEPWTK